MGVPPQLRWLAAIGCGTVLFLYLANFNLTPRYSDHVGLVVLSAVPEERSVRRVGGRPASQDDVSEPTPRTAVATVAVVDPSDRRGWEPAHSKQSGLSCKPSASGLGVAISSTEATALKTAALHGAGGEVIIFSFFILTKVGYQGRLPINMSSPDVVDGLWNWTTTVAAAGVRGVFVHSVPDQSHPTLQMMAREGKGLITIVALYPETHPRYARLYSGAQIGGKQCGSGGLPPTPSAIRYLMLSDLLDIYPCTYCISMDATDVLVRRNPFPTMRDMDLAAGHHNLFDGNEFIIYDWQTDWVLNEIDNCFSPFLGERLTRFKDARKGLTQQQKITNDPPVLNAGLLGGHISVFRCAVEDMAVLLTEQSGPKCPTAMCDMASLWIIQHYTELGLGPGFQLDPAVTSRLHGWNNSLFQKINQGHPFNCPYRQKTWPKYRVNASNTCMIAHK